LAVCSTFQDCQSYCFETAAIQVLLNALIAFFLHTILDDAISMFPSLSRWLISFFQELIDRTQVGWFKLLFLRVSNLSIQAIDWAVRVTDSICPLRIYCALANLSSLVNLSSSILIATADLDFSLPLFWVLGRAH
jgi:hypothetical protein